MRSLFSLGLILCVVAGVQRPVGAQVVTRIPRADTLPYEAGSPIPPGYHVVERSSKTAPIVLGSVLLSVTYAGTALVGLVFHALGEEEGDLLLIPVAGPFLFMLTDEELTQGLLVDGIVQAGALGLIIFGANLPSVELVRDGLELRAAVPVPMVVSGGGGLTLSGTF